MPTLPPLVFFRQTCPHVLLSYPGPSLYDGRQIPCDAITTAALSLLKSNRSGAHSRPPTGPAEAKPPPFTPQTLAYMLPAIQLAIRQAEELLGTVDPSERARLGPTVLPSCLPMLGRRHYAPRAQPSLQAFHPILAQLLVSASSHCVSLTPLSIAQLVCQFISLLPHPPLSPSCRLSLWRPLVSLPCRSWQWPGATPLAHIVVLLAACHPATFLLDISTAPSPSSDDCLVPPVISSLPCKH